METAAPGKPLAPAAQRGAMTDFIERRGAVTVRTLSRREAALLDAIAARILPSTDTPGAVEAGAIAYIQAALDGPYRPLLRQYRRGLRELDAYAVATHGQSFVALGPAEQDAVLTALEQGAAPAGPAGRAFFELVRRHVLEGVFGEPAYGGNRDLVGWRLVGFPGHQFGYPDPYINRAVDLIPVALDGPPGEEA